MKLPAEIHRIIIAAILMAVTLTSCRDNGTDEERTPVITDIVEYAGFADGLNSFILYPPQPGANPITLAAPASAPLSEIKAGEAMLLAYIPASDNHTRITIRSYARINNLKLLQSSPDGLTGWDTEPVYLHSVWLAGNRLNLRVNLTYDTEPRRFAIIIDENTIQEAYPEAYLYHQRANDNSSFSSLYYASCPMDPLFSRSYIRGIRLHIFNANTPSGSPQTQILSFHNPTL